MNSKDISEYSLNSPIQTLALEKNNLGQMDEANSSQQLETDAVLKLALKHQLNNSLTEAEKLYRQIIEKQPSHLQALYNLPDFEVS